jgi:phage-related baseplate assembly protein
MPNKHRPVADDQSVQLATRISRDLHKRMKLYCVGEDIEVMDFVREALTEYLQAQRQR